MRGRKPIPTALHEIHGNPSRIALKDREPKLVGDLTDAPTWLSDDQKTGWTYAVTHAPPGVLKRIDRGALVAWVIAEDLHRQAATAQATTGLLVRIKTKATAGKDDPGVPTASPYLNIINQQAKIMLKAASELGFTPVSRPRIFAAGPAPGEGLHAAPNTPISSLDAFLAGDPDAPTIN